MTAVVVTSRKFSEEQIRILLEGALPEGMTRKQAFTFFKTHGIEPTIEKCKIDLWRKDEIDLLRNNVVPEGRTLKSARTKAFKLGISFCPNGNPCPQLNLPYEKRKEIAMHADKFRNRTRTGLLYGVSRNYVLQVCHEFGVEIGKRPHDRLGEHIEYEGNNYSWKKGSWICTSSKVRASGKFNLGKILYEKYHGEYPGDGYIVTYKDGNRYNLTKDNLVKLTYSEAQKLRLEDDLYRATTTASAIMGLLQNNIAETIDPSRKKKRIERMLASMTTEKRSARSRKMWDTRRKNAEKNGYFYTEEQRKKMSESRIGKSNFKKNKDN